MIIKDYLEHPDGTLDYDYEVNEEEADVLIRFAIERLIEMGWIDVDKQSDIEDELGHYIGEGGTLQ